PQDLAPGQQGSGIVGRCVQALKASARLSDVIGRLSPTEFAVLAPGTDAAGARRLAERLASSVSTPSTTGEPATAGSTATPSPRVRCGYEAVANVGYAPIEPVDLLVRAAAAVRRWLWPVRRTRASVPVRVLRMRGSTPAASGGLSINTTS